LVLLTTPQRELQSEQLITAAQADGDAQIMPNWQEDKLPTSQLQA